MYRHLAIFKKRLSHGLQYEIAYTWSKSIDNASSFENILKPICNRCNRSLSLFDARQRVVFSYLWELPVPKYQGAKGKLLTQTRVEIPPKETVAASLPRRATLRA